MTNEALKGYRRNAMGNLIAEENITPLETQRDELVNSIVKEGQELMAQLEDFRQRALLDIQAHVELAAEKHGVKLGGKKGNVKLLSFDGRFKVTRAIGERLDFDEQLLAAKELINECLHDWTKESNADLKAIVNEAFKADAAGNLSTSRVLGLRTHKISDERWKRAMEIIGESVMVVGSKTYIRIYERDEVSGEYQHITLK